MKGRRLPGNPGRDRQGGGGAQGKNIDVSTFTVHVKDQTTLLFPIDQPCFQIEGIVQPAIDAVANGNAEPSSLTEANNEVNALFG